VATLLSGSVRNPSSPTGFITLAETQAALGNTPTTSTGYTLITVNNIATYSNTLQNLQFATDFSTETRITSQLPDGNIMIETTGTGTIYLLGNVSIPFLDAQTAFKGPVEAATTGTIDLIGGAPNTVDGVTLELDYRILVRAQDDLSENGIYTVSLVGNGTNGTWVRADDNSTAEKMASAILSVQGGDTLSGRYFYTDFLPTDVLDVDPVNWYQIIADNKDQSIENKNIDTSSIGFYNPGYGGFSDLRAVNTTTSTGTDSGALIVTGGAGIGGDVNIGGITKVDNGTSATSTFTGAMQIAGGLGVNGAIYARAVYIDGVPLDEPFWNGGQITSPFYVANIENATSTMTGALKVLGGAGIGGSLYVGESITLESPNQVDSVYFRMRNTATNGQSYTWRVGGNNFAGQSGANLNEGGLTLYNDTNNTYRLAITKTTGNLLVGVQTDNGTDKLQVSGSMRFGDGQLFTRSTSINNTSTTVIDSFPATSYRTAKLLVQVADGVGTGAKFHVVEIVVLIDNDGNVYKSEYGIITTGGSIGLFDVDYNVSGNGLVRLLFTADETSAKLVKVLRTSISR
jgi:hypothetical protein